ncbi:MAG: hypothetical protein QW547_06725 [Candidatus Bathyarchaeia archaeon]
MMEGEYSNRVFVIFWFDCEDFVTPESDNALKRLAEILKANNVRGVFKLVGEKLRVLEKRKRFDVIEALKCHEIGYHTDYHSVHPTVAEYLKYMDFEEGALEFIKREGKGVEDIRRIFNVTPSCYGQPGGAWAPHVYLALKLLGISTYLDVTDFIDLDGRPFWYCGILNILNLTGSNGGIIGLNFELGTPGFIEKAIYEFDKIYQRILNGQGWGIISIFNHPCTLVTKEFWDAVNFSRGLNTPMDMLKPAELKPKNWVEAGYVDFDKFVKHVKSKPFVEVVTANDLQSLFRDSALNRDFSENEIAYLASSLTSISFKKLGDIYVSASEVFWLITASLAEYKVSRVLPGKIRNAYPLGPYRSFETELLKDFKLEEFLKASYDTKIFIELNNRIPDFIEIEGVRVSPVDFLASEAELYIKLHGGEKIEDVKLVKGNFEPNKYVSIEGAKDCWNWIIFPEGFKAWNLVELAKLQTWTIKPATIRTK